jgi:hypothetical protein
VLPNPEKDHPDDETEKACSKRAANSVRAARLLRERILLDRKLLGVKRQLAAGRSDDLGVDRSINGGGDEPDRSVTKDHVAAPWMSTVGEGKWALDGQVLAEIDVLVGPNHIGKTPAKPVNVALGLQLTTDAVAGLPADIVGADERAEISQWTGPVGLNAFRVDTGRACTGERVFAQQKGVPRTVIDRREGRPHIPRHLGRPTVVSVVLPSMSGAILTQAL